MERLEDRCLLSYAFTKIADTNDGWSNFGDSPALNNNGTVAFLAHPVNDRVRQCIVTGDGSGGDLTRIACEGPLDVSLSTQPSIADDGTVAYVWSFRQTTQEIRTGTGGDPTTLYATSGSYFTGFGSPALNQAGTVAFWAATLILSNPEGVFRGDGGEPTIIDRGDSFDTTHFGQLPSLNNDGIVAYRYEFRGPAFRTSINVGDGKTTTVLYSNSGADFRTFGNPVVNDAGQVAFFATLADGRSGIFSGDGGALTVDVRTDDVVQSFADAPALNNSGLVAVLGTLVGGTTGLFTAYGTALDPVLFVGEDFQGSQVAELHFFRQGLNDAGQLVFAARLADGTSGIYRADPTSFRGHSAEPSVFSRFATLPMPTNRQPRDGLNARGQRDDHGISVDRRDESPHLTRSVPPLVRPLAHRLPAAAVDRVYAEVVEQL
jgi:hypothetical protein